MSNVDGSRDRRLRERLEADLSECRSREAALEDTAHALERQLRELKAANVRLVSERDKAIQDCEVAVSSEASSNAASVSKLNERLVQVKSELDETRDLVESERSAHGVSNFRLMAELTTRAKSVDELSSVMLLVLMPAMPI